MEQSNSITDDRYFVGTVKVSAINQSFSLAVINNALMSSRPNYICVTNTRAISVFSRDWTEYRKIQNESLLSLPDGMPLVWIAWAQGLRHVERVTGYYLMTRLFEKGYSHYFLGDTMGTLQLMTQHIHNVYSKANVVGVNSPPYRELTDTEVQVIAAEINRLRPDFIWVGLGSPRQEFFIARIIPYLDRGILVGVGAAFRFLIGKYKAVPPFMQKIGLEGLVWRFTSDPMRLIRVYPTLIRFIVISLIKSYWCRYFK